MSTMRPAYQPGVCNIGPAEIRARRLSGVVGTVAAVGLLAVLVVFGVDPRWRVLVFLPAAVGAGGFLQAAMHFCANYGWRGVFNVGSRLRDVTDVTSRQAAAADRRAALRIGVLSALVGAIVAVAAALLPA